MQEKHKCKLCWKNFVTGRSLGGHMRSHMLSHPESASSSVADPRFFLQDRESETESSKKPTRKRSTLNRRPIYASLRHQQQSINGTTTEMKTGVKTSPELSESCTEQEPVSSVSNAATAEEDVALSLMMLSRDRREKKKKWFECETCEKEFKSYQALGGHRSSHKKKRASSEADQGSDGKRKKNRNIDYHECQICFKVFSSGQALGGHRRSHANKSVKGGVVISIDLNLPAPLEEEDLVSSVF